MGPSLIPFFVVIPLASAFLIALLSKKLRWLPDFIGNSATAILMLLSLYSVKMLASKDVLVYSAGAWKALGGARLGIIFALDGFASFMLVTVNLVAFLVAVFSINYMRKFTAKGKFYTLFLLMLAGMNGVLVTGDIFNLFVFLEIASVASYALVAFGTERHELEAAFKYAVMGTVGSLFILLAIVFLYSLTSSLNMADIGLALSQKQCSSSLIFVSVLFILGFGLKAALVPFHAWLPDAHPSAPAPISAMLSGVLIKSLGVYTLVRIFFNILGLTGPFSSILMGLGVISMIVGAFLAIGQWDFKRLLAYSSISQIGYIILAFGLNTHLGIIGGLFHLFNHSIFKSLLFLNSGAVEYATGTRDLKKMGGLAQKMPITSTTALSASMSIAGIPPFSGFWSKLIIIIACIQAEKYWYAFWAVLVSIVTLGYFLKVIRYAFSGKLKKPLEAVKEVPIFMKLSMIILAVICLVGGLLFFPGIREPFLLKASGTLLAGKMYAINIIRAMP